MADTAVAITAGSGTNIDTRTEGTNGNHRQVVVVGDPATNAGVAPVDATNGLSVTLTTAVPAGTNAIGKLAANSGVDIGDVDVTSSALPTGASTAANQSTIIGHVDGIETVLGTIDADTSTLAGAVAAGQMQVDIVADGAGLLTTSAHDAAFGTAGTADAQVRSVQGIASMTPLLVDATGQGDVPVTLDGEAVVLGAGTAGIGKLTANSGVDIGDVDVTSIAAGDNNIGNVDIASAIPAGTNTIGKVAPNEYELAGNTTHTFKYYTASAPTDGIVWSPAAGKRWYVTDIVINVDAASVVTLEDDQTGGDVAVMKLDLAANSGITHSFNTPLFSGEDAADLIITASAGNVYVTVTGYEI